MEIKQAILPVAGLGTRFLPWTKVVPKELLPIGNEPIIGKLVDECLSIGVEDICFVISPGKELITQYFNEDPKLETELERRGKSELLSKLKAYDRVRFHTVYQHEQLGDGHAIMQAAHWVQSEHVAVLFGDDMIIDPDSKEQTGLTQLLAAMNELSAGDRKEAAMLGLQNVPPEKTDKYGIVDIDPSSKGRVKKVTGLVEKPAPEKAPSTLGIVGKYIIPKSTIEALPGVSGGHGGEIRLIDALIHQLKGGMPVFGCEFEGKRLDTGTPEGYKEAVKMLG
jgi:UTP--glucose-1-phosphate uridylyltransferase